MEETLRSSRQSLTKGGELNPQIGIDDTKTVKWQRITEVGEYSFLEEYSKDHVFLRIICEEVRHCHFRLKGNLLYVFHLRMTNQLTLLRLRLCLMIVSCNYGEITSMENNQFWEIVDLQSCRNLFEQVGLKFKGKKTDGLINNIRPIL